MLLFLPSVAATDGFLQLEIGTENYRIAIARTQAERRLGLMFHQQLDRNAGMLLVYRDSGDHRIWMKNVLIPLRVYWLDSSFTVIEVQRLEPCSGDPCPVFSAASASMYVLELSDYDHALEPGDRIEGLTDL